jgi:hypothetical protein
MVAYVMDNGRRYEITGLRRDKLALEPPIIAEDGPTLPLEAPISPADQSKAGMPSAIRPALTRIRVSSVA